MSIWTLATFVTGLIIGVSCTSVADNSLKADGIGPVRLGAVINSLPKSSEGLFCILFLRKMLPNVRSMSEKMSEKMSKKNSLKDS